MLKFDHFLLFSLQPIQALAQFFMQEVLRLFQAVIDIGVTFGQGTTILNKTEEGCLIEFGPYFFAKDPFLKGIEVIEEVELVRLLLQKQVKVSLGSQEFC